MFVDARELKASALSYRLDETLDVAATALEMGNNPAVLLRDNRELTTEQETNAWFAVDPKLPKTKVVQMARMHKQSD